MARVVRPWFRFYVEMPRDRKIRRLTPAQRWIWCAILAAARESPEPGRLLIAPGVPMNARELADYADVRPRDIRPALDLMTKLGMVSVQGRVVSVTNWGSRQYESDNVTARTRAHRERSNERSEERSNDVPANGRRNGPETETETEQQNSLSTPGGERSEALRAAPEPPPPNCSKHPDGTDDPCAPCGKARLKRTDWDADQQRHAALVVDTRRREANRARLAHIADCELCDPTGYRLIDNGTKTGNVCNHQPTNPGGLARALAATAQEATA